jgi:DnaK suppressor protein
MENMDNAIEPAVGSWYQRMGSGQVFQVVAVDDDERLVEFQHYDGDLEEVALSEWQSWDLEVTDAPEDWTGPMDGIERGDPGYSELRSEGERRGLVQERERKVLEATGIPGSGGRVRGRRSNSDAGAPEGAGAGEPGPGARTEARADGLDRHGIDRVKKRLTARREELRRDIRRELEKYDDESYTKLAERVADTGDQAWSDLLSDVNLAEITRDVNEVRGIEAAFERLAEGNYGICMTCGERIDPQRLEVKPSAVRCLDCQRAFETRDRQDRHPTL